MNKLLAVIASLSFLVASVAFADAQVVKAKDGTELHVDGDKVEVMKEGKAEAANGEFELEDGSKLKVENGMKVAEESHK
jgi:hypothetical protein